MMGPIVTPDNELISTSTRVPATRSVKKTPVRRRASSVLAGLAVIGFSAAMMAPTGMAMADPQSTAENAVTTYSLAAADTQSITVSVEGTDIAPVVRSGFEVYVKPKPKPVVASSDDGKNTKSNKRRTSSPPPYTGGGNKEQWMTAAGIAKSDWTYVNYIVSRESGWNPNATNRSSGACGLVQVYPCSKLANAKDPVVNLRWANGYAKGRYGGWSSAYSFWKNNHWW